ncbi:Lsr2 family protein [Nocardia neocaledoniensis NBRC 108232]|uniref:Lsr2 protein n=1 Tax=Nocardia neocaledoniensis TaxID=236511 RepID=A0A317NZU1_9NOCA|nr:Lsr2 family protein [Nocardia neocaledoniensis]PWV79694.1 Lsr2 protein [Nocardia neocaledoniensis]GEM31475.1 Lsr2 family protein [Nocardia neocaledoniensis NBRC 108232]
MARKVVVTLIDDFDGTSVAEDSVSFGIDGAAYEIDLSATNAAKLRETFDQWLPYARRIGRTKPSSRRPAATEAPSTRRSDLAAIRAWASENGHTVSSRGRISSEVIAAYDAASA